MEQRGESWRKDRAEYIDVREGVDDEDDIIDQREIEGVLAEADGSADLTE